MDNTYYRKQERLPVIIFTVQDMIFYNNKSIKSQDLGFMVVSPGFN